MLVYENLFFKKKLQSIKIEHVGYKVFKINKPNIKKINLNKEKKVNKYFKKIIISEKDILLLINEIFLNQNLAKNYTAYRHNYNITFMLAYKTYSILKKDRKKLWHTTIWHKDKPFSKNTLKLIFPINRLDKRDGELRYTQNI